MSNVFGITGWKNSGKTTLVARLVEEFTGRGLTVSTLKHASDGFQVDKPGTDTDAHRQAGASEVAIVSRNRWAIMNSGSSQGKPPGLGDMLAKLSPCDLVLVEGFKASDIPKIECIRMNTSKEAPIWPTNPSIKAIASDSVGIESALPVFDLDDIAAIADMISEELTLSP